MDFLDGMEEEREMGICLLFQWDIIIRDSWSNSLKKIKSQLATQLSFCRIVKRRN
jgi:hypothetical protein